MQVEDLKVWNRSFSTLLGPQALLKNEGADTSVCKYKAPRSESQRVLVCTRWEWACGVSFRTYFIYTLYIYIYIYIIIIIIINIINIINIIIIIYIYSSLFIHLFIFIFRTSV